MGVCSLPPIDGRCEAARRFLRTPHPAVPLLDSSRPALFWLDFSSRSSRRGPQHLRERFFFPGLHLLLLLFSLLTFVDLAAAVVRALGMRLAPSQPRVRNGAPVAQSGRSWASCAAIEAGFISTAALVLHRRLWPSNVACYCLPCNHRSITNVPTLGDVEQPLSQDRF